MEAAFLMKPVRLHDVIAPYLPELDAVKLDMKKISSLRTRYNGQPVAFVDVVMEGGGVKGLAVSGALFALEYLGIRFRKIAGTSAGAINAAHVAGATRSPLDKRIEKIAPLVLNMNLLRFVDGGKGAKAFIKALTSDDDSLFMRLNRFVSFTRNIEAAVKNLGINPGHSVHQWLQTTLSRWNQHQPMTVGDLIERHKVNAQIQSELQVVVSDLTNRRMAVFPRDLHMYVKHPEQIHIADLVRASISVPFFFEPFRLGEFTYDGGYPDHPNLIANGDTLFVDGMLTSNFPIHVFDVSKKRTPKCPTFGIIFDDDQGNTGREIKSVMDYMLSIFETVNQHGDRSYLFSQEVNSRIIRISNRIGDKRVGAIYFNLTPDEIQTLFGNGIRAAMDFIQGWDFKAYLKSLS